MKKFLVILTLFLGVLSYAQSEKSEDKKAKKNFEFGADIYLYGATYKTISKNGYLTFSAYEFWPYMNLSLDNVTARLQLGIDQFMGSGSNEDYAPIGSDVKGVVKVEQAYVEAVIPFLKGLSFIGGVADYETPGALILSDNAPLFRIKYLFGDNYISVIYMKIEENLIDSNKDDSQIIGVDGSFKIGEEFKVVPALYILSGGKALISSPYRDSVAIVPSILLGFENPVFNFSFAFAYGDGKDKVNSIKYSGYAFDLSLDYKFKNSTVGGFITLVSGDNGSTSSKFEGFSAFRISGVKGRMLLLENKQTFSTIATDDFADIRYLEYGYIIAGLLFNMDFGFVNIFLNGGYAQVMKAKVGTDKKDLGVEIDLKVEVPVQDGFKILLESAYLNTGGAWGLKGFGTTDIQNSMYVGLGVVVSF